MLANALGEDTVPSGKAEKGRDRTTGLIGSHRLSWTLAIQKNKEVESVVVLLGKRPPQAPAFEHLVPSWWRYFGR